MPSCPSCGVDVPEGFAFCGRCGVPLAAGAEERRVVTVLFSELAGRFLDGADTPSARYQHSLTSARAVLAETHGDLDLAAALYSDTGECWRGFGVVLEQAQALLGLARCAARGTRTADGDPLAAARRLLGSLGATALLAEADGDARTAIVFVLG